MHTLSNVSSRQNGLSLSDGRDKPAIIPEVQETSSNEVVNGGVSSDYAQMENCQWYVLRATYNRVGKGLDILKSAMAYTYLPKRLTLKRIGAKNKRQWEPLLPNMVFVYSSQDVIEKTFRDNKSLAHYRFYRDKTQQINGCDGKHPPIVIPYEDMMNFIRLTSAIILMTKRIHKGFAYSIHRNFWNFFTLKRPIELYSPSYIARYVPFGFFYQLYQVRFWKKSYRKYMVHTFF